MAPFYPLVPHFILAQQAGFEQRAEVQRRDRTPSYDVDGDLGCRRFLYLWSDGRRIQRNAGLWDRPAVDHELDRRQVLSEKGLYFYLSFLPTIANLENDVVSMIAGIVSNTIIYLLLSNLVYGGGIFTFPRRSRKPTFKAELMKILLVTIRHQIDSPSGSARVAHDESVELARRGHEVWVLAEAPVLSWPSTRWTKKAATSCDIRSATLLPGIRVGGQHTRKPPL